MYQRGGFMPSMCVVAQVASGLIGLECILSFAKGRFSCFAFQLVLAAITTVSLVHVIIIVINASSMHEAR